MDQLRAVVDSADTGLWNFLFVVLIGVAIYMTIRTRFIQIRGIPDMFRVLRDPAGTTYEGKKGVSAFRAFTVSAASRVGTGNIAGVAIAISTGGPGAVFWMWFIALFGAATAFVESLLGQLYKRRGEDSYIGGPAYYMERGLRARWMGVLFAVMITVTYAFVFNTVQSNAIVAALGGSLDIDVASGNALTLKIVVGVVLALLAATVIFGGINSISAVTSIVVPVMAIAYLAVGLLVVATNLPAVPGVVSDIIAGAFGLREFVTGSFMGVLIIGLKRGLFSNEAGIGSVPNASATASVSHPAKQGLVQSLGVYFDTMLVCSVTAIIILMSKPEYGTAAGADLTQTALGAQLGPWAIHFLTVAIFLFAFTSVLGNYYYGESNIRFFTKSRVVMTVFRVLVLGAVFLGAMLSLELVWSLANVFMGLLATINLVAIVLLCGPAVKVMRNYSDQRRQGIEPTFHRDDVPGLVGIDVWDGSEPITTREYWDRIETGDAGSAPVGETHPGDVRR